VTGTLLVGVLIGQLDITISTQVKSAFFMMFLFAVGYSVGPQFVRGVAKDGAPQAVFAVVICALSLTCTYLVAKTRLRALTWRIPLVCWPALLLWGWAKIIY
jgi:putative transport protein